MIPVVNITRLIALLSWWQSCAYIITCVFLELFILPYLPSTLWCYNRVPKSGPGPKWGQIPNMDQKKFWFCLKVTNFPKMKQASDPPVWHFAVIVEKTFSHAERGVHPPALNIKVKV